MPKQLNKFLNDYSEKANIYASHSMDSGTLWLAYKEFGALFSKYVTTTGNRALDYGTGTGRSRRYLEQVGFDADGADIDTSMLDEAKKLDCANENKYFFIENGKIPQRNSKYDLVFSSLVVLEIGSKEKLKEYMLEASRILKFDGTLIILTVNDDFYKRQWVSIDTNYPGNESAKSGDKVKIKINEINLELEDYYWTKDDYINIASQAGFSVLEVVEPKGGQGDQIEWRSEIDYSPYAIFVLKKTKCLNNIESLKSDLKMEIALPGKGSFTEIYRDPQIIPKDQLGDQYSGERNKSATLRLLMQPGDKWPFHRLQSQEILKHIEGNDLIIHCLFDDGKYQKLFLGEENDNAAKEIAIPKNCWYAEEVEGSNGYCLIDAVTMPGFHPDDSIEATKEELLKILNRSDSETYDEISKFLMEEKVFKEKKTIVSGGIFQRTTLSASSSTASSSGDVMNQEAGSSHYKI